MINSRALFLIGTANYSLQNYSVAVYYLDKFIALSENTQDHFDGNYINGLSYFHSRYYNMSIHHLEKSTEVENPLSAKHILLLQFHI